MTNNYTYAANVVNLAQIFIFQQLLPNIYVVWKANGISQAKSRKLDLGKIGNLDIRALLSKLFS